MTSRAVVVVLIPIGTFGIDRREAVLDLYCVSQCSSAVTLTLMVRIINAMAGLSSYVVPQVDPHIATITITC